ncbi:hypothetical protein EJ08DRAFT_647190 [Tothia fuscella]|uniref:Secreted protein n=1 Tax=Tothia fuscella TaxID=1048955 RepID=A0A9P4NW98_9PEZI|nr:hypothetical protein EJ08DRAFT_647190 [Tothia fuscella]
MRLGPCLIIYLSVIFALPFLLAEVCCLVRPIRQYRAERRARVPVILRGVNPQSRSRTSSPVVCNCYGRLCSQC